jgi:hypothetical protein
VFLSAQKYDAIFSSWIQIFPSRIPDPVPGVKKALDPGSATLNSSEVKRCLSISRLTDLRIKESVEAAQALILTLMVILIAFSYTTSPGVVD